MQNSFLFFIAFTFYSVTVFSQDEDTIQLPINEKTGLISWSGENAVEGIAQERLKYKLIRWIETTYEYDGEEPKVKEGDDYSLSADVFEILVFKNRDGEFQKRLTYQLKMKVKENSFEYTFSNFGFQNPPTMVVKAPEIEPAEVRLIEKLYKKNGKINKSVLVYKARLVGAVELRLGELEEEF